MCPQRLTRSQRSLRRGGSTALLVLALGFVMPTVDAASAHAQTGPAGEVTVEYVAHASFIVESPLGTRILIDPYADRIWLGYDFPDGLDYDAVVITHPHYDHDGGEFRGLPVPWPEGSIPVYRDAGEYRVEDVRLVGIAAKHADPYGKEFGQKNVVWVLDAGGLRIVHVGDNGPLTAEVVEAMGVVDVLMIPVDGEEHILTFDAVDAAIEDVSPQVTVPMHYRIPELEPADGPSDLGPVDPWLAGRDGVRRLDSNVWRIGDPNTLTDRVVVFQPSPAVPRPGAEAGRPAPTAQASEMRRVTMAWTEAPIQDVLRAFAVYSGRSIVAGAGVEGIFVTAHIEDHPWDVGLQSILESRGLAAVENENGIIRVETFAGLQARDAVQPVVTRSYRISYARAGELRAAIASLLTERGSVSAVESSNTLVVSDTPRVHGVVARLLGR